MNFNKSTIGLHYLLISFMLAKFPKNQRSLAMSSINCLNYMFLKLCIKNKWRKCTSSPYISGHFPIWFIN